MTTKTIFQKDDHEDQHIKVAACAVSTHQSVSPLPHHCHGLAPQLHQNHSHHPQLVMMMMMMMVMMMITLMMVITTAKTILIILNW